jgi:hypothetical protein
LFKTKIKRGPLDLTAHQRQDPPIKKILKIGFPFQHRVSEKLKGKSPGEGRDGHYWTRLTGLKGKRSDRNL